MNNPSRKTRKKGRTMAVLAIVAAALAAGGFALAKSPAALAALGLNGGNAAAAKAQAAAGTVAAAPTEAAASEQSAAGERIVEATAATSSESIESTGNLEPSRAVDLAFSANGVVTSVEAVAGRYVEAGTALAALDDRDARYQLADADIRLQTARISGNQKQAELVALERDMKAADLEDLVLRAPFAGVISSVDVTVGDSVSASKAAVRLLDRSKLKAVLEIDEIDLPSIKIGQRVDFTFDAFPKKEYQGRITLIPQEGKVTSQGLAVFPVEATIYSPPSELRPGYSFVAAIVPDQAKAAVTIPSTALVERSGSMYVTVWKGEDQATERRKVTATRKDDGNAEVTEGLAVGEKVVIASASASSGQARSGFNIGIPGMGGMGGGMPPGAERQSGNVRTQSSQGTRP